MNPYTLSELIKRYAKMANQGNRGAVGPQGELGTGGVTNQVPQGAAGSGGVLPPPPSPAPVVVRGGYTDENGQADPGVVGAGVKSIGANLAEKAGDLAPIAGTIATNLVEKVDDVPLISTIAANLREKGRDVKKGINDIRNPNGQVGPRTATVTKSGSDGAVYPEGARSNYDAQLARFNANQQSYLPEPGTIRLPEGPGEKVYEPQIVGNPSGPYSDLPDDGFNTPESVQKQIDSLSTFREVLMRQGMRGTPEEQARARAMLDDGAGAAALGAGLGRRAQVVQDVRGRRRHGRNIQNMTHEGKDGQRVRNRSAARGQSRSSAPPTRKQLQQQQLQRNIRDQDARFQAHLGVQQQRELEQAQKPTTPIGRSLATRFPILAPYLAPLEQKLGPIEGPKVMRDYQDYLKTPGTKDDPNANYTEEFRGLGLPSKNDLYPIT